MTEDNLAHAQAIASKLAEMLNLCEPPREDPNIDDIDGVLDGMVIVVARDTTHVVGVEWALTDGEPLKGTWALFTEEVEG